MRYLLGLDLSTQSFSSVLIDPDENRVVDSEAVSFGGDLPDYGSPNGFLPETDDGQVHADPRMWLEAFDLLLARLREKGIDLSRVSAVSGAGQQHGSVYLDATWFQRVGALSPDRSLAEQLSSVFTRATSPIWMDSSTGAECREIAEAAGGNEEVCARSGSVATERFTGPQIRAFWKRDRAAYERTARIHLVSSYIASVLAGRDAPIDFGDGAGMNLANIHEWRWDEKLAAATAPGLLEKLPPLQPSATVIGTVAPYFVKRYGFSPDARVVAFTGDNPSSLIGMGAASPGRIVISLGTSDTLFAAMEECRTDPRGFGHVFGNPYGGYMSLLCFRNGSLAREKIRDRLGLTWSDFDVEGLRATPPGNNGNLMIPFFGAEITPRGTLSEPVLSGSEIFVRYEDKPAAARACLEGQFLNMWLHTRWLAQETSTISLTGGASRNDGIAQIVADVFGAEVNRLEVSGSVALGGALRAGVTADGLDGQQLADVFCRPNPGSTKHPDQEATRRYRDLAEPFADLLKANLTG